ncbi:MAG: hypothetical protein F9K29_05775 [Hyphomicrobiaceae bacterium]|nr:MAG: hypothetical protein F9K29_05775 [Hyphomicrobiaceae bacterium]
MAKGYSKDLRERAVLMVEEGESRREVARLLICSLDGGALARSVGENGRRRGESGHRPQSLAARGVRAVAA